MSFQGATRTDPYVRVYAYGSYREYQRHSFIPHTRRESGTC
jgi:hypothetical protein